MKREGRKESRGEEIRVTGGEGLMRSCLSYSPVV